MEKSLVKKKKTSSSKEKEIYNPKEFEGKEIQPAPKNDDHLDEHGRVVHEDKIQMKLSHKDLIFIHQAIRDLISKGLVPEPEVGPCISLLEILADAESDVYRHNVIALPVNYFVGMWHCLNSCRKFSLYSQQWKKKDRKLDHITMVVASYIDKYHKVKEHEYNEEKINKTPSPKSLFKELGEEQKGRIKYLDNPKKD